MQIFELGSYEMRYSPIVHKLRSIECQMDIVNYATHFGIQPQIAEQKNLVQQATGKEIDDICYISDLYYHTITRICLEKAKQEIAETPFEFLSAVRTENNGLISIGDHGRYDKYGIAPDVKEKAYHLARANSYDLDHFLERTQVERAALEAVVRSIESKN
jgi:hypothetical protein